MFRSKSLHDDPCPQRAAEGPGSTQYCETFVRRRGRACDHGDRATALAATARGPRLEIVMTARKQIRFNAFDMNCVAHQSPGLWRHPEDQAWRYKDIEYWTHLARTAERGIFDGIFVAEDRKSTRLNSSHNSESRMPSSA
jgi:hypothetical protein